MSDSLANCAGPDHLQGHQAVEADLAGLVNDPHAADGQLLEQLVVAEPAHAVNQFPRGDELGQLVRMGSQRLDLRTTTEAFAAREQLGVVHAVAGAKRRGHAMELFVLGEVTRQFGREVGVLIHEGPKLGFPTSLGRQMIGGDHFAQLGVRARSDRRGRESSSTSITSVQHSVLRKTRKVFIPR